MVNLTQAMVSKILLKHAQNLPTAVKLPGYQRRLSNEQLAQLPKFLEQGAEFYEFTGAYWTHNRVKYVISKEFNVDYEVKQVGRILDLIGWTWQKPQKKEAKQDLKKVEKWVNEDLPALKKKH
jgi:transposase